jgi:hypothetical protein
MGRALFELSDKSVAQTTADNLNIKASFTRVLLDFIKGMPTDATLVLHKLYRNTAKMEI